MPVDVRALDCDFYAFSSHKIYGPTGVGVLYGKAALLEAMPPYQGGGDMIRSVTFEKTTCNVAALQVRGRHAEHRRRDRASAPRSTTSRGLGLDRDRARTSTTCSRTRPSALSAIPGLTHRSAPRARRPASSPSSLDGIHPHDIGTVLDREGIAIRTGHHCAQPVMDRFGLPATARASFGLYNTRGGGRCPRRRDPQSHRGCSADVATCATSTRK